jgi:SAM-dependent methyltransferase
MKKTVEEHAARFSEKAAEYDDANSDEYRACASLVVEYAAPNPDDVVLDLGAGTGAIALALAPDADRVLARDISEGMMDEGRRKAEEQGLENVEFAYGEFRAPAVDADQRIDIVTSNFALHHLGDDEKREAIHEMAATGARRIVLGDVAFFETPDADAPFYSPEVDDPATVGTLVEAFTAEGFAVTAVERVHDQVAVIVAERLDSGDRE